MSVQNKEKCFIMLCSNKTEEVCIQKKIMGAAAHRNVDGIKKGTEGLLLNYNTDELIGIFRAREEPRDRSGEPDPWDGTGKGPYPIQFEVDIVDDSLERLPSAWEIFEKSGIKTIPAHPAKSDGSIPESSVYPVDSLIAFKMGLGTGAVLRKAGMRAAVAAIMGRNMSHNIGSHVLARLAETVGVLDDKEGIRSLLEYLQRRMDFIAQVSTATPSWAVDLRWGDVVENFLEQQLLLDNIIRFKGITRDNLNIEEGQENMYVSFPTRLIGCHALYTIFENLLRNAARYGYKNGELTMKVHLEEYDNDFYRLNITDRCGNGSPSLIDDLNKMFSENLVDPKGNLSGNYWGMKEIKIAASYLRFIEQENIDAEYERLEGTATPLVRALLEDGNLKYEFFLPRPKKAFFLSENKCLTSNTFASYGFDQGGSDNLDKANRYRFLVLPKSEMGRKYNHYLPIRTIYHDICSEKDPSDLYRSIWQTWLSVWCPDSLNAPVVIRAERVREETSLCASLKKAGFFIIGEGEDPDLPGAIVFDHTPKISMESKLYRTALFHAPFSGGGALYNLWQGDERELEMIRYDLMEAAFTTVAIIDSRISEVASKPASAIKLPERLSFSAVWAKMGVDLLDHEPVVADFTTFVKNLVPQKYKFLIIHQGELDDITPKDEVFDIHWNMLMDKVRYIVIDTGRGRPDQARKSGLRWLPYTDLQNVVIRQASGNDVAVAKHNLTKLLFSLVPESTAGDKR